MIARRRLRAASLAGLVAISTSGALLAQSPPPDFIASPEVYKVISQNDRFAIVQGTWKAGQRDQLHSHPALLFYWLSDCRMRWHSPDGTTREFTVAAGQSGSQPAVASHFLENIGPTECKILMFEAKPAS